MCIRDRRLEYLKGEKTMEIIKRIEIARGFGDLSENSEYDDAKREQQENEAEKHRIEEILKNYVLIDETDLNTDTVRLGPVSYTHLVPSGRKETGLARTA